MSDNQKAHDIATTVAWMRAEIERLRARVEVLEGDATRYQWLKEQKNMSLKTWEVSGLICGSIAFVSRHYLAANGTHYKPYETLDETIDSAIKEAKP
jgi:hypothetical protein